MLKLIAWIIFFYLLFRILRNLFWPFLGTGRNTQHPFNQPNQNSYEQRKNPGTTTIHKTPGNSSSNDNDDDGEYIDYKEIKD